MEIKISKNTWNSCGFTKAEDLTLRFLLGLNLSKEESARMRGIKDIGILRMAASNAADKLIDKLIEKKRSL